MAADKPAGKARRKEAQSAALGAWWCFAVIKGGILALLVIKDGDLNSALGMEPWAVAYSFFFFTFFVASTIMYFILTKSDPGYVNSDEEFTLLEAGKPGKAKAAAGENGHACDGEGVEMQEIDIQVEGDANGGGAAVNRKEARAQGKANGEASGEANGEANGNGNGVHENGNGAQHTDVTQSEGVRSRQVPKSDSICEITEVEEQGTAYPPSNPDSSTELRRCRHCATTQLLRTKHCYDCGRCVYTFDHHCFWIGNCVGEKNHRIFYWYVALEFITVAWACELCLSTFVYANTKAWARDWFVWNLPSMFAFLICLGFAIMLGALLFFHTYIIFTGQTSWEIFRRESITYMKGVPAEVFPFSLGWKKNLSLVCLRPHSSPPRRWPLPSPPWDVAQRFWWIENEYWSCF